MENTEGTVSSEGVESSETEQVEIEKATDEDLESYLKDFKAGKYDDTEEEPKAVPTTESSNQPAEEAAPQPKQSEEVDDRVTLSRAELEELQQRVQKQERENRQKEEFIQRQKQQLGEARQEAKRYRAQLEGKLEDATSQAEAYQILRQIEKTDEAIEQIDGREAHIDTVRQTYETVSSAVDLNQVPIEDVVETLRGDGLNDQQINTFFQNPWQADPSALVQLFRRSKDRTELKKHQKALQDLVPLTERLFEELKKAKGKPERLLSEVSKAMKAGPSISASSGNSSPKRGLADVDVTKMSSDELDQLYEETKSSLRR